MKMKGTLGVLLLACAVGWPLEASAQESGRPGRSSLIEPRADEVLRAENEQDEDPLKAGCEGDMRWFRDLSRALAVVHLTTLAGEQDDAGQSMPADMSVPDPSTVVIGREISQILHRLVDTLPEAAGNLIRATYFEGLTLQEAGDRLGVSKSWASRLHARTLQRLARSLRLLDADS